MTGIQIHWMDGGVSESEQADNRNNVAASNLNTDSNENEGSETLRQCPICLESVDNDNTWLTTKCQHSFHTACITKWIHHSTCPLCREAKIS